MRILILLVSLVVLSSCNAGGSESRKNRTKHRVKRKAKTEFSSGRSGYEDGVYCAEVEYYYSGTGTRSTYVLEVEVKNNELTMIHWPSGGWLDDSHFYPPDISEGFADFESDKGVEYKVEIIGREGDCSLSYSAPSESSFVEDEEEKICSRCGSEKFSFEEFCDECVDEIENTCSRCGGLEYGVYGGLCSDCQAKEDENDEDFF